jgi:hypothetical protein
MECDTSYGHYKETLNKYLADGYSFIRLDDYFEKNFDGKSVLMRHDIDKCPNKALDLARIENELGIRSTYFVRVHSNYYNPFGYADYNFIRQIRDLGHDLSLHSEAFDFGRIFKLDPMELFRKEIEIFITIFDVEVKYYAPHRTHNSSTFEDRVGFYDQLERLGYKNVYEILNDKDWKYLSDSSGIWVEGCFCQHVNKWQRLFLLVHPVWWFDKHIELEGSVV